MARVLTRIGGWGLVVAVALTLAACKKSSPTQRAPLPAELERPRPAGDPAALPSPALLAHVPADTPYVMASLAPVPTALWSKLKVAIGDRLGPSLAAALADVDDDATGPGAVLSAIAAEMAGKWDAAGLTSLGLTPTPNYVIYGLGLAPVVLRIDIGDEGLLMAAVERIATRAQLTLPPPAELAGRRYWRIDLGGDTAAIIGLGGKQLVVAGGPAAAVDSQLPLILGSQLPPKNLSTTRTLQAAVAAHGFGPHFVGYVDVRRMLEASIAMLGVPNDSCRAETAAIADRLPRLVMGYEFAASRITGGVVLELATGVRDRVAGLRHAVPGMSELMAGQPMFAMGVGLDLERGRLLARDAADALGELGGACDIRGLVSATDEVIRVLSQPLPPVIAGIAGGAMAIHDVVLATDALMPTKIDALALIAAEQPQAVLDMIAQALPITLAADGKLHPVALPEVTLPGELVGGIGARALVFALGPRARAGATSVLAAPAGGVAPLVVMAYDYGRFLALQAQFGRLAAHLSGEDTTAADAEAALNEAIAAMYGRASFAADVTDKGLVMWGSFELK